MPPMHERAVAALGDPQTVLLLLALGLIGVCLELSRGGILPGVAGAACIVLAVGSPAARSFDGVGDLLVAGSFICSVFEATIRTRGILALASAGLMLWGLLRIDPRIGWSLATAAAVLISSLVSFLLSVAVAARRSKLGILRNGDTVKS
jgi:membrane-bound ClpP family serine protease